MALTDLGHTLVIANPVAQSGAGAEGARFVERALGAIEGVTRGFEIRLTRGPKDATQLARAASSFDTVLALGGDGVIHEVVCGLMELPAAARPQLGVVPLGSGNDFARTLGMARNDAEAAFAQLVRGAARPIEIGRVNGVPFMQTFSFGLDASIALDTTARRANDSLQEGEALFITSGLKVLSQAKRGWRCRASFDGEEPLDLEELIFAVQVGPSYGGGFKICPEADPEDGLLDVCYNVRRPAVPVILGLFGMARWGGHARSHVVRLRRFARAVVDFEEEPPCQIDGEGFSGTHFEIEVVPQALRVIFPSGAAR